MNNLVGMLNPIDSRIIVIASFPERAFLFILQIATAINRPIYNMKLNGRGTTKERKNPTRGIITIKISASLYHVPLSNPLLGLAHNYINFLSIEIII
jgi:hypothetical protein